MAAALTVTVEALILVIDLLTTGPLELFFSFLSKFGVGIIIYKL